METERASVCNVVINFLFEEGYLLTAFELLHELTEDGHADRATRLRNFFADPELFPPDDLQRMQTLNVANPQRVVEERDAAEATASILEYELRLAQEDIRSLQEKLERRKETPGAVDFRDDLGKTSIFGDEPLLMDSKNRAFKNLGPLRDSEKRNLNHAIKEFLLAAGYKLTAMTFHEEVDDQDLDDLQNGDTCVPDALRRYYLHFLSAQPEAIEEKDLLQEEKGRLEKDKESLLNDKCRLVKGIEVLEHDNDYLVKSLEAAQNDIKERERQIYLMKESLEKSSKDLNECRIEITSLKLELESSRASRGLDSNSQEDFPLSAQERLNSYKAEIASLRNELEMVRAIGVACDKELLDMPIEDKRVRPSITWSENSTVDIREDSVISAGLVKLTDGDTFDGTASSGLLDMDRKFSISREDNATSGSLAVSSNGVIQMEGETEDIKTNFEGPRDQGHQRPGNSKFTKELKQELETVEILADALPKIVPYVLINHREELLPLMMCAIERHPDCGVRDLLTHTLFNLIKRPDEKQRKIIMDACVCLSRNIGEERAELELLPQCWEQINHKYEERRLLVAHSCGELAQFVKPDMRASLILSIVQQLIEDPAAIVREAASHNLAILLPLFPNTDKYFKVEELVFQLICDPSGIVVEKTLKELVPALVTWARHGDRPLSQLLRLLLSHLLGSAQRCPPASGVEGSVDAELRVLGERERWNVDVLLRMLVGLFPEVHDMAKASCPYLGATAEGLSTLEADSLFTESLLRDHLRGNTEWPTFDWLYVDCVPALLQLTCMLPSREESLRTRLSKVLLTMSKCFGNHYLSVIMLPIFLTAVGDVVDLSHFSSGHASRIKGLKPKTATSERLAVVCILPLLLAGVLGAPSMVQQLSGYLRMLMLEYTLKHGAWTPTHTPELIDAIRFLCTFEEHHDIIVRVLWELVVNTNADVKITAANLLKVLVAYVDIKFATQHVLPALVTLGSDPNLHVKYSSIDAFGAVAQHFKDDGIIEKIRVQMDAFLEDGSHEATVAVVRTLAVAVPLTTSNLRDYLLQKLLLLTAATQGMVVMRRRERADVFCEAVRALDATDISSANVKEQLLLVIQNLLKDPEALDPAHKEALENIVKERSGGRLETITKVMGTHLSMSGMSSLFADSGFLSKKDTADNMELPGPQPPTQEEGRLMRIMRGNFGEMIRGRGKASDETFPNAP